MNKKLLIGIVAVVVLIILAALLGKYIGYDIGFERATKNLSGENTKDWKTYRNEFYGLEFKYPPQDNIHEWGPVAPPEAAYPIKNAIFVQQPQEDGGAINIFGIIVPDRSYIRNSGESYIDFISKPGVCGDYTEEDVRQGKVERDLHEVRIGIFFAKELTLLDKKDQLVYTAYCIAHSRNPLIIFYPLGVDIKAYPHGDPDFDTFNQVFSTFRFTN